MTAAVQSRTTSKRESARLNLILAAERLMVEQGMDAVSLRQIGTAAGQKNAAALQYHFGSRRDLVWAVMELRTAPVNTNRQAMLAYIRSGAEPTIDDIARALVLPLMSSLMENRDDKTFYARFMARVLSDPETIQEVTKHPSYQSIRDCARLYRDIHPQISRDEVNMRMRMASSAMIMEAAELERLLCETDDVPDQAALDEQISRVTRAIAGLLSAPA